MLGKILMLSPGIIILGYSLIRFLKLRKFLKIPATVVGSESSGYHGGRHHVFPVVEYEVEDKIYRTRLGYAKKSYFKLGKQITIYCNPSNHNEIDSLESYIFVIISGLAFLIGGLSSFL